MKPILFNTDMIRALLEDRKTVTRRVVKPQPVHESRFWKLGWAAWSDNLYEITPFPCHTLYNRAPYHPGDILYVRETFCRQPNVEYPFVYKASVETPAAWQWCPSIHMPREAARIFLRVTDVRVERLQEVDTNGAYAEGIQKCDICPVCVGDCNKCRQNDAPLRKFARLWDTTIKSADCALYGWDANPWVWVIEFERISREEAADCV